MGMFKCYFPSLLFQILDVLHLTLLRFSSLPFHESGRFRAWWVEFSSGRHAKKSHCPYSQASSSSFDLLVNDTLISIPDSLSELGKGRSKSHLLSPWNTAHFMNWLRILKNSEGMSIGTQYEDGLFWMTGYLASVSVDHVDFDLSMLQQPNGLVSQKQR